MGLHPPLINYSTIGFYLPHIAVLGGEVPIIASGNNINDDAYKKGGRWYMTYQVEGLPYTGTGTTAGCIVETIRAKQDVSRALQRLTVLSIDTEPLIFVRTIGSSSNTWGNWYKIVPVSL